MTDSEAEEDAALAAIVRSSRDAVIAKTVDGLVTAWNEGAHELYGYTAQEMLGRSIETLFAPETTEVERARHARILTGGCESGYRCQRVRADGRTVEVVMSLSPVLDAEGRVTGIASISRPVSAKERADARFSSLLDAAPDAIICVGTDGLIATVNAQVREIFGYRPDELTGQPVEILLPEEVHERHRHHQDNFRRAPKARSMGVDLKLSARRKDGTTFPVEVSLAPGGNDGDDMVIAAVRDVTRQRAIEDAIRESEILLRQLADSVETGFLLRQLEPPAHLYVSHSCDEIFGVDRGLLRHNPDSPMDLVHPDDRDAVAGGFMPKAVAGLPAASEHRIVRPDGSMRWIRMVANPVSDAGATPRRTVITVEDITERVAAADALREAEAAARTANDAKNEFLSRMSHELRTPLNAVLGFGQLLERQLAGSAYSEPIRHILMGGRHLLDLINDVLDIAKIEAGEMSISLEPVPIASLVDETVQLMRPLADASNITLITSAGPGQLYAMADRQRLRQIVLNLLSNAVKYNRPGGHVWITAAAANDDEVTFTVRDDGPGIPASMRDRVFTAFDRLGAEGRNIEGTGIGLAVTRSLAELMGGRIVLTQVSDEGCCFEVTVPRAEIGSLSALTVPTDIRLPDGTAPAQFDDTPGARLLYIEDNQANVLVVEHLLTLRPGWLLIHAALGGLGLELAAAQLPDLILLDLHLPDRSGYDVLAALKAHPATQAIPVAILSADANAHQSQRLIAAGAVRYLTKPLDVDAVLATLDTVMAKKVSTLG